MNGEKIGELQVWSKLGVSRARCAYEFLRRFFERVLSTKDFLRKKKMLTKP